MATRKRTLAYTSGHAGRDRAGEATETLAQEWKIRLIEEMNQDWVDLYTKIF